MAKVMTLAALQYTELRMYPDSLEKAAHITRLPAYNHTSHNRLLSTGEWRHLMAANEPTVNLLLDKF